MKLNRGLLELVVEDIDNYYLVTKTIVIEKGFEWITKGSLAYCHKETWNNDEKRVSCYGRKFSPKNLSRGSLPIFDLTEYIKDGTIRPLTKEEKYDILMQFANMMSKKSKIIRRQARRMLDLAG